MTILIVREEGRAVAAEVTTDVGLNFGAGDLGRTPVGKGCRV
jgi:hypothetical protein